MSRILVTSFDSPFFRSGLTLIAGIHRTSSDVVDRILVYDLGLTPGQKTLLKRCEKVEVLPYPEEVRDFFEGYLEPGQFAWKPCAIKHAGQFGSDVFWLDAGVVPVKSLALVYERIEEEEIFLVQDQNRNRKWTRERAFQLMDASEEERNGDQLCAGILGYKTDGKYQGLIDKAYEYSQNPEIVRGAPDVHRHDQSIYSILAIRSNCPTNSLELFGECRGPDMNPNQVIYVHRGELFNIANLRINWPRKLSVCLTTYNAEKTIGRVLGSLAAQVGVSPKEWEVVLVDNDSTDGTLDKARDSGRALHCPFRVISEVRQGGFYARRRAALSAEGRIIAILDHDMPLDQGWLKECIDFFDRHPRAGVVGGKVIVESGGELPDRWTEIKWMYGERDYMGETEVLLNDADRVTDQPCGGGTACLALPTHIAYESQKFHLPGRVGRKLFSCEDVELAWRICQQGWESWYTPSLVSRHIIDDERLSERNILRLRFGIAASCVVIAALTDGGTYPGGRKAALRQCYQVCVAGIRQVPLFFKRDFESRLKLAGVLGRIYGTFVRFWRALFRV